MLATLEKTSQVADVASAKAGVEAAESTLKQVQSSFTRQRRLKSDGYTTQTRFDTAEKDYTSAQASLDVARSVLATAEDKLDQTQLRADAAGIVVARKAEAGQVVDAAQTIYTTARDGGRDAVFDVNEALLAKRPRDQSVELVLLSNPSIKATGQVREVSPVIDPSTSTVRVKVTIENPPAEMELGAPVSGMGRFQSRAVVALPWTALCTYQGEAAVWVVDPASKAVSLRPVGIDSYKTGQMLISDGLKSGELVVTAGSQLLYPGQLVEPTDPSATANKEVKK